MERRGKVILDAEPARRGETPGAVSLGVLGGQVQREPDGKKASRWGGLWSLHISFKKSQNLKREGTWILAFPRPPGAEVIRNLLVHWPAVRVAGGELPWGLSRMASPLQREGAPPPLHRPNQ